MFAEAAFKWEATRLVANRVSVNLGTAVVVPRVPLGQTAPPAYRGERNVPVPVDMYADFPLEEWL